MKSKIGFRLLSELYSLLYKIRKCRFYIGWDNGFPSPLGVIFSLITFIIICLRMSFISFRLLSELYSLLYVEV